MQIIYDGSLYLEKGERIPLKCPKCGNYVPYSFDVAIVCGACGHRDCHEEFANVTYQMATKQ